MNTHKLPKNLMSQIPPEKRQLKGFAWYDYVRPLNRDDVFVWRGKKKEKEERE